MADRIQKVLDKVRQELAKAPETGSRELYEMAKKLDSAIGSDTLQQFHARYVLPFKREQSRRGRSASGGQGQRGRKARGAAASAPVAAAPRRARRSARARGGVDRDHVRGVLLRFAQEFAGAETKPEIVKVMTRLDEFVNEIAPA